MTTAVLIGVRALKERNSGRKYQTIAFRRWIRCIITFFRNSELPFVFLRRFDPWQCKALEPLGTRNRIETFGIENVCIGEMGCFSGSMNPQKERWPDSGRKRCDAKGDCEKMISHFFTVPFFLSDAGRSLPSDLIWLVFRGLFDVRIAKPHGTVERGGMEPQIHIFFM